MILKFSFFREEWEWLQTINADQHVAPPTNTQQQFRNQITEANNKLLNMLEVSDNMAGSHRLYDLEVMEFSNDVTFLLVLPPVEDVCIVPGQQNLLSEKKDFMLLPVQVFEMSKYYGVLFIYYIACWVPHFYVELYITNLLF